MRRQDSIFIFVTDIYKKRFCVSTLLRCPANVLGGGAPSSLADRGHSLPSLDPATGGGRVAPPTSYARRPHNPSDICEACYHSQKETPSFRMGFLSGCGGRTRTYDLRVMSPTSYQLLYSAIWGAFLNATILYHGADCLSRSIFRRLWGCFGDYCRTYIHIGVIYCTIFRLY